VHVSVASPLHVPRHGDEPPQTTVVPAGPQMPAALPLVPSQTWQVPPQLVWQHVYPPPVELAIQLPLAH
jgi:hypothetical protein